MKYQENGENFIKYYYGDLIKGVRCTEHVAGIGEMRNIVYN
jgi:hypothetical protein